VLGDEEVVMQAVEVEAVAPVSVCFGRLYAASGAICPQDRRDVAAALPQFSISDDGACATPVVALGQLGGKSAEWPSSPMNAGFGSVRREAVAPCL
jgi:hypothetical protein